MNIEKIPPQILSDLRKRLSDEEIESSNPESLFADYCEWHGLRLWGGRLVEVLDSLRTCEET